MDLEQYKIYLKADPRSREPEFLEASQASVENASAHAEALAFEDKLEQALRISVPSPSEKDILAHCLGAGNEESDDRKPSKWLATAAGALRKEQPARPEPTQLDAEQYQIYLQADPRNREPAFLEASRASIQNASAHAEAQAFEDKLERALRVPVIHPSEEEILLHCWNAENVEHDHSNGPSMWLAMAASVLLLVGVASVFWPAAQVDADVREAFVAHLDHPEPALTSEQGVPAAAVALAFANQGIALGTQIENVSYMKPCLIGDVQGMHLVLTDDEGHQVTVMVMPDEPLERVHNFVVDAMTVQMISSDAGAIALFGHQGQDLSPLARTLARGLTSQAVAQL